ncbi:Codeine O-demethylase, partial [Linum perenne]
VLGVNSHTDRSVVTFLIQDKEVEGLQLLLDEDEWVRVLVTPVDALIISVGDQGEIISNGMFKSRLHRAAVNAERPRKSVAIFCAPELDKAIGPVDGGTKLAKYKVVKNYEREFFKQAYNRAFIDSLKL